MSHLFWYSPKKTFTYSVYTDRFMAEVIETMMQKQGGIIPPYWSNSDECFRGIFVNHGICGGFYVEQ